MVLPYLSASSHAAASASRDTTLGALAATSRAAASTPAVLAVYRAVQARTSDSHIIVCQLPQACWRRSASTSGKICSPAAFNSPGCASTNGFV